MLCLIPFEVLGADPNRTVKIGLIVPLSGDMAIHGNEILNSMGLARELSGSTNYEYRIIPEDNQLDGARSVSAARKLIDVDKVDVLVTLWPPTANAVIPLTERAGILHYTIAWDPNLARKSKLVLSHQVMVGDIARASYQLLRKEGYSKVAFLHMEEAGFNLGAKYIAEASSSEGMALLADESFNPNETDFRPLIDRVQLKKPEAYLIWAVMPSIDTLIKQIKERAPDAKITGYLDFTTDVRSIEGAKYISEMYAADTYAREYQRRFGSEPISKGPNAFDIMNVLITTFEKSSDRKMNSVALKAALTKLKNIDGAVGPFAIDADGNSSYTPVVRQIQNSHRAFLRFAGRASADNNARLGSADQADR